jgi:Na+(H+)/acetate symporter ActP
VVFTSEGYGYMALLVGWTGGYVLVATLLAPYLRKIWLLHSSGFRRYKIRW